MTNCKYHSTHTSFILFQLKHRKVNSSHHFLFYFTRWLLPISIFVFSTQENSGFSQAAAVSSSSVLSRTITNLTPYTKYYFKVASYSEGKIDSFSKVISATTLEDSKCKENSISVNIRKSWESCEASNRCQDFGSILIYVVWLSSPTYLPTTCLVLIPES